MYASSLFLLLSKEDAISAAKKWRPQFVDSVQVSVTPISSFATAIIRLRDDDCIGAAMDSSSLFVLKRRGEGVVSVSSILSQEEGTEKTLRLIHWWERRFDDSLFVDKSFLD